MIELIFTNNGTIIYKNGKSIYMFRSFSNFLIRDCDKVSDFFLAVSSFLEVSREPSLGGTFNRARSIAPICLITVRSINEVLKYLPKGGFGFPPN